MKVLIPNSTAGMIIGKGGSFIKQIKEESGAYVQISQKSKETNLPERCITVAGECFQHAGCSVGPLSHVLFCRAFRSSSSEVTQLFFKDQSIQIFFFFVHHLFLCVF